MYAPYFGLHKEPFSIAPDPRFLFMSDMHREALAHLLYGLGTGAPNGGGGGGGFVLLTGEIGAGKTTVCRAFLEQVPAHCVVAYIFNPRLSAIELLQTVCEEFGVDVPPRTAGTAPTLKDHVDALNRFLLAAHAQGRQGVLIIDEAQSLDAEVLEQLRLLTNLETHERKLLQIVLIGQPELRTLLAQPQLEQLAQRVIARYHLPALGEAETAQYVRHRLAVAGPAAQLPFDAAALARIHRLSGGVPRRINLLCDRALLGAYAHGQPRVGRAGVDQAAAEVFGAAAARSGRTGAVRASRQAAWAAVTLRPGQAALAGGLLVGALLIGAWVAVRGGGEGGTWRGAAEVVAEAPSADRTAGEVSPPGGAAAAGAAASVALGAQALDAEVVAPAPAPARSDPAGLLAAASASEDAAWPALGLAWDVRLPERGACDAATSTGLACYRSSGGLAVLRALDRPSLLRLRQADAARGWVRLVALSDNQATLQADGQTWRLSLPALATVWRGEFATLWRLPPGWGEGLRSGAETPVLADWLQQQLTVAGVAGGPASVLAPAGDDATASPPPVPAAAGGLRARVLAFQVATGLPPDGVAGPMTLMRLNRAAGLAEPRLTPL